MTDPTTVKPSHGGPPSGGELAQVNPLDDNKSNTLGLAKDARERAKSLHYGFREKFYPAHQFAPSSVYNARGVLVPESKRTALPAQYGQWDQLEEDAKLISSYVTGHKQPAGAQYNIPVTGEMVGLMRERKASDWAAEFDQWLHAKVDYNRPGEQEYLRRVAPDFIERRLEMLKRDLSIEFSDQYIRHYGCATRFELEYLYGREKGLIRKSAEQAATGAVVRAWPGVTYVPGEISLVQEAEDYLTPYDGKGQATYNWNQNTIGQTAYPGRELQAPGWFGAANADVSRLAGAKQPGDVGPYYGGYHPAVPAEGAPL
jgi:hypothetical protein